MRPLLSVRLRSSKERSRVPVLLPSRTITKQPKEGSLTVRVDSCMNLYTHTVTLVLAFPLVLTGELYLYPLSVYGLGYFGGGNHDALNAVPFTEFENVL